MGKRRWAILLVVCCTASIAFGWWVLLYVGQFQKSREWRDAVDVPRESESVESLFKAVHEKGLITVDGSTFEIRAEPCEALYRPDVARNRQSVVEAERLFRRLCETGTGRQILDEIAAWNATLSFVAIRDNRQDRAACSDNKPIRGPVISRRCKPSDWNVELVTDTGGLSPFSALPGVEPPLQDYAHAASAGIPFMSDWLVAATPLLKDASLRFSTVAQARRTEWMIDVVGELQKIFVGGEELRLVGDRLRQSFSAKGLQLRVDLLCNERDVMKDCLEVRDDDAPFTMRITVRGALARPLPIMIEARSAIIKPRSVRRFLNSVKDEGEAKMRRTAHLGTNCAMVLDEATCTAAWIKSRAVESFGDVQYRILLADRKTQAVDENGAIRPEALRMGLAPIVGVDREDIGSLTSALSQKRDRQSADFILTIDPKIQSRAADILRDEARRRISRRRPIQATPRRQRMAIVVVDASDKTAGEILAMASWPALVPNQHVWDLNALAAGDERNFPLAGHAWRATDVHNMPGSTFKIVTALAAIQVAAAGDKTVGDLLTGSRRSSDSARLLGIDLPTNTLPVPTLGGGMFRVHNSSDASYDSANLPTNQTRCPPAGGARVQLGLCEAILKSSNLWFAGMALRLDRSKLMDGTREHRRDERELALAKAARQLFWVTEPDAKQPITFDLLRGKAAAERLRAVPIRLPVMQGRDGNGDLRGRQLDLALNGYGQGVEASALAVASIYASVAVSRTIRPRLVPVDTSASPAADGEGQPLITSSSAGSPAYDNVLRSGLFGVANARAAGTAEKQFRSAKRLQSRLFVKTGTAITVGDFYSAWLAGWIEPASAQGRRLAFACWITHTSQYGADACAPVIKKLFEGVE
jgi:cell division protein FtsI/penicillin-binding protein 2